MKATKRMVLIVLLCSFAGGARSNVISFNERFALAGDREQALQELIPGTLEYYYYHALHLEHEGRLAESRKMIDAGVKKFNHHAWLRELENRHALKSYPQNPEPSLRYLRDRLGLHFNHQQKKLNPEVRLPTALNQDIISFKSLAAHALKEKRHTGRFENSAFDYLVGATLNPDQRRSLLSRLQRPDYPGLISLVVDDLNYKHSGGFGQHPVHKMLTLQQLEACLLKKPELIKQTNFIQTYLLKLRPNEDVNWQADDKEKAAYLKRLQAFADRLPESHNSLKANILFKQLEANIKHGVYDQALFMRYIKMPRPVHYINKDWLNRKDIRHAHVDLNHSSQAFIALPPIRYDEVVVRRHLMHFLKNVATVKAFDEYIEYNYLKRLFAEVKLVNGIGDAEKWYALMDSPSMVKALRDRIDIELLPTNKDFLEMDEKVSLHVALKNVDELMIKVYDINTAGFYRQHLSPITTAIELDGLVPNVQRSQAYTHPPMRRTIETLQFPELQKPGVYVIELIGNGVSSRAVVRKGRLTFTQRVGSAGHVFRVYDGAGGLLNNATLWMEKVEYTADEGEIHVPFSGSPKKQPMVLSHGGFSVLRHFQHLGEQYALNAGMYLGREQLVSGKKCTVAIRPELLLNGEPIDLALLENPVLTVRSLDLDGHAAEQQVNAFTLENNRDASHTFRVPERLRSMTLVLSGQVQNLNSGEKVTLAAERSFAANQIKETEKVEDLFLRHSAKGFGVELLGRNAEALAGRAIHVQLKHRDFKKVVHTSLKTDEQGRVHLGVLNEISWIKAQGPEATGHTWALPQDRVSRAPLLHIREGETLRIPVMHTGKGPLRRMASLLETRGGVFVRDALEHTAFAGGYLVLDGLTAGDYSLMTKPDGRMTTIRVTAGREEGSQLLGKNRVLERKGAYPLQIQQLEIKGGQLLVKLANALPGTRVHVAMTRYVNDDLFLNLGMPSFRSPGAAWLSQPRSQYLSGRKIGDEYRYVMERSQGMIYPGNMLTRPSLILNPWSPRSTDTGTDKANAGEAYREMAALDTRKPLSTEEAFGGVMAGRGGVDAFSSFDFLNTISPVVINAAPDKNGVVKVPLKDLPDGQQLHVYAVHEHAAVYRQRALDERSEEAQDLRLTRYLDPDRHFTEQKRTQVVRRGETFSVKDILSSKIEVVDSVTSAYRLLTALNDDPTLAEFNFITQWPDYPDDKKQTLYKKYACHELHVFLALKDPAFFKEVVRPYLVNKKDPTFIDDRLLGRPLEAYLEPWAYSRLNMAERALLARQVKPLHASTARHLKDLYDLLPPDIEKFNWLFDAAMRSSGLEGVASELKDVLEKAAVASQSELSADEGALGFGFRAGRVARQLNAPASAAPKGKARKDMDRLEAKLVAGPVDNESDLGDYFGDDRVAEEMRRKGRDAAKREAVRQFYRKLEKTKEWVENNYYQLPIQQQVAGLIPIDAFWKAYAQWDGPSGFLSGQLTETGDRFTEMMLALAVLDLPFTAGEHDYQYKEGGLVFTAASDLILFHKQVQPAADEAADSVLLINQSFFAQGDRYRYENNERFDKFVKDEFEKGRVYGCQLVLTNPTSTRRKVDVLQQIPAGAIPILGGMQTRSRHAVLEPYSTQSQEYYFYFPEEGEFPHYPVHVAQNEQVVAAADPFVFHVVSKVDELDKESWGYISQYGSTKDVVSYLNTHNINRLDLDLIAWRMRDKPFFREVLSLLVDRKVYQDQLWSYSIYHNMPARIREYLPHTDFANRCGLILASPLLELDPIRRTQYEHKEYWPLVNARIAQLGAERKILNQQFHAQYEHFMKALTYRPALTDEDEMALAVYLLLQDRVEEAMRFYDAVDGSKLSLRIQHDYLSAYMAFYREQPAEARKIALSYKAYPVDRWRNLFAEVVAQCDEIEGEMMGVVDETSRTQAQTKLADTAPRLDFELEGAQLNIEYAHLAECTINYYPMDIELLFSHKPFVQDVGTQFTVIKPNRSASLKLIPGGTVEVTIPEELKDRNLMVEVAGAGLSSLKAYYPNALDVDLVETYGQLRVAVAEEAKALSKVYVKVYARMKNGEVKFFKDGYTDLRGRFDYTSLNTDELDSVDRFALLILSEQHGAVVREAHPPKR